MLQILESVVTEGTAPYAKVKGYRVAGKTGTTKKLDMNGGGYGKKYIGSFKLSILLFSFIMFSNK